MTDIPNQTNRIEENEETSQNVDVIKRPRGRPKKEVIPVENRPPKRPQCRPSINPPKEKTIKWKIWTKSDL